MTSTRAADRHRSGRVKFIIGMACALCLTSLGAGASAWHEFDAPTPHAATAIGKYSNGCLLGGEPLPDSGPGYQAVRLARKRNYGHPWMVDYVEQLGLQVASRNLGIMLVADMAMPRGGRFRRGHRSHQSGLDADIWLRLDAPALPPSQRQGYSDVAAKLFVDRKRHVVTPDFRWKHAELIRLAAQDQRVARIFVHPAIKKDLCERRWEVDRGWLRKIRPWWGHDAHFHVRLRCPPDSDECHDQNPPPEGEGCGAPVEAWLADLRKPPTKPATPPATPAPTPRPPASCLAVLKSQESEVGEE